MSISPISSSMVSALNATPQPQAPAAGQDAEVAKQFNQFVGESLFGQMLKSMRKTQGKPAYFHGGRAEEVFQQQLDQVLAQKMAETSGDKLSGPMYQLFSLQRR